MNETAVEKERREQRRKQLELRATVAALEGIADPERYEILALPSQRRGMQRISAQLKQELREHLEFEVALTFTESAPEAAPAPSAPEESSSVRARVSSSSCAACQGFCCTNGGTRHAYLDAPILARYRAAHPEQSAREVVDAYVNRVGDMACEDSCLYHGPEGCTLSRDMRSDTCNTFFCPSLMAFRDRAADAKEVSLFVIFENGQERQDARFVVEKS